MRKTPGISKREIFFSPFSVLFLLMQVQKDKKVWKKGRKKTFSFPLL
jgi:hypothetical protein